PSARQDCWRISIPNTAIGDVEAMLRDGVQKKVGVGDTVTLAPDTGAVAAQIESAVNSLIAQAQANSAYLQDTILHHSSTNPRIIQVPMVETSNSINLGEVQERKVIGFASLWLTGASQHELKGYFVAQNTSTGR